LRTLIEGLPGLISWFDQDLNYLGVNEQFLTFNKKSRDEFIGKKLGSINNHENSKLKLQPERLSTAITK
jgi:PAS domain-containing protein